MKIALVSPSPLPALRYGGTERALMWLYQGLKGQTHDVLLIAPSSQQKLDSQRPWPTQTTEWLELARLEKINLFHFMCLPPDHFPLDELFHLVTVQGNGKPGEKFPNNTVFVSNNHALRHNADAFVYNGLDPAQYPFQKGRVSHNRRALFLAKASWTVKNLRGSLRISKKSGFRIDVAGGRRPLAPWGLFSTHARFHGMVDDSIKLKLLSQSDVLLFPVLWHEPFGIAVIEALASGLPVVATPYGSLPELVSPECGLLSNSEQEMIDFLETTLYSINPKDCRSRVEEMFTHLHMTKAYLNYYHKVLANEAINSKQPQTLGSTVKFLLDPKSDASGHR